jgi:hypothetical protein
MRKHKFLIMNLTIESWVSQTKNVWVPPNVGIIRISHESTWVPHMGPPKYTVGPAWTISVDIRVIHERSDDSPFLNDVAGGRISTLGLVCKDSCIILCCTPYIENM